MPLRSSLILILAAGVILAAQPQASTRLVRGLAALMQATSMLQEAIAAGELTAIHDEDANVGAAAALLRNETMLPSPASREAFVSILERLGRESGDLHQSADGTHPAQVKAGLRALLTTYARLTRFYSEADVASARQLAEVYACPMHRTVVGPRTATCPRCGMPLDQPVRIRLSYAGQPEYTTVRASIEPAARLQAGQEVRATLRLQRFTGRPILLTDLRIVHTQRIHLLIVDPTLTDYHHVHPEPTATPGVYAFSFTPATAGPYRAWADLRPAYSGFQEYAVTDIPVSSTGTPAAVRGRAMQLETMVDGLRYRLIIDAAAITAGEPIRMRLRATDRRSRPFTRFEPIMGTFAHLAAFHENWKTVLHLHPIAARPPAPADRAGPELSFQFYATEPGFYRLFAQVQIGGVSKFPAFGLSVAAAPRGAGTHGTD